MAKGYEAILASVPLFDGLSKRHLKRVYELAESADYMANATVVKEGTDADAFYVILSGMASVMTRGRRINRLMPGDYFGEISLLDGGVRTASVRSETALTLLIIQRKAFLKLLNEDPTISLSLLAELAKMIRRTERSLAG
jgi:CRP/FNR family transcriptional regulator, cyclic AMP receptor protein